MTQFSDLVGEHELKVVPIAARHPFGNDAEGVCFMLDDTSYFVFEDENDGYRSSAGPILSFVGAPYEFNASGLTYIREAVICSHRTRGEYSGEDDVLEVRSKETGELIFEVGTTSVDDYYPSFVNNWRPQGLSANAKANAHD